LRDAARWLDERRYECAGAARTGALRQIVS
jgi:hypothetical protein